MANNQDKINQLMERLETLNRIQQDFTKEVSNLRAEIEKLNNPKADTEASEEELKPKTEQGLIPPQPDRDTKKLLSDFDTTPQQPTRPKVKVPHVQFPANVKSDIEKFIGENLINKIGIVITIIGVAIGAKYSIENNLISPLTRIILGYLTGLGLLGFGIKLKKNYKSYSAVLVSGAMAIMYFITYAAYSFYDLFPQEFAFALMLVFTVFTVIAAINYDKPVIAHIGLVGAYAVPFLLSEGSGRVGILFSYMAIINSGILVIAFKKYWKSLYYVSFALTWLMFAVWYASEYQPDEQLGLALTFLTIFFGIFYLTFLAYKLIQKEKFNTPDIILLLANSFIFYAIGYAILDNQESTREFLGLFTLGNAIIHFMVSTIIYRQKLADRNLFYLISGLVLVFITIAIPVQLDGTWVTLLWAGEAALLFWIGRTKDIPVYEKLSLPLMVLAFVSILQDWNIVYHNYSPDNPDTYVSPLFNIHFLTSVLFIAAFGFINYLNSNKNFSPAWKPKNGLADFFSFIMPAILLFATYFALRLEIVNYWDQLFLDSEITLSDDSTYPTKQRNQDLWSFKIIWILNYSLLFFSALAFININKLKNQRLGLINLGLLVVTLGGFLIQGLYELSELRESYLQQHLAEYYHIGSFNIIIRYVSFVFVALALIMCRFYIKQDFIKQDLNKAFDILLSILILWILSSELINWMDIAEASQSYKLGLSILWGIYSLLLITLGIWKKKKHIRIGAIVLFGITLIKLFFYDISHLDTIAKTIVFVSLGILLLIISFLYNKFKHIISDEAAH